ncbi:MAG: EAL domain-containing protein [Colwellia sp.]
MYTFSQLLQRNSILALIFTLIISATSLFFLSSLLSNKTEQHQQVINAIAKQAALNSEETFSAKGLTSLLQKTAHYKSLVVSDKNGNVLVEYSNSNSFVFPVITPDSKQLFINELALNINYQLDFSAESSLVLNYLLITLFLIISMVFFSASMSSKRHALVFKAISQQIKNDLSLINDNNISDKDIVNNDVLNIPELKQGISDIKKLMSAQLEGSIALEQKAYIDHLTSLDNRSRFVQFYENQIVKESPVKFGVLLITRCSELQTINQIHGYNEGDKYISRVADIIKTTISTRPNAKIFRLNSSDFASILPNIQLKEAEDFAKELTVLFNEYQQASDLDSVAYTGLVFFDKSKPLGELLALADTGVSVAQTQHSNSWYSQKDIDILSSTSASYGNQNWRQEIDSVIENQRITLLLQPILPSGRNSKVYGEILARFLNSDDEMLPTASFIAMAEKLDKIVAIDKLIIETTIKEITHKNIMDQSFGINISSRSISDEHFMIWLERKLLREPNIAPRLIFEITEYGLQQNIKTSKRLIDMLHRVGARVTVERFGVGLTSFKFFRDLTPDYIKMDSSYTRDIDDDKNNQYFLRLMVDLAHRLSINVLAESVESQEEKHTLEKLFIDGCQGFYIGKPTSL